MYRSMTLFCRNTGVGCLVFLPLVLNVDLEAEENALRAEECTKPSALCCVSVVTCACILKSF